MRFYEGLTHFPYSVCRCFEAPELLLLPLLSPPLNGRESLELRGLVQSVATDVSDYAYFRYAGSPPRTPLPSSLLLIPCVEMRSEAELSERNYNLMRNLNRLYGALVPAQLHVNVRYHNLAVPSKLFFTAFRKILILVWARAGRWWRV